METNPQQPSTEEEQRAPHEGESVAEAAAEVVASLARLGLAVAQLPVAFLPPEYRNEVRESARDIAQAASYFPRAMSEMLKEFAEDLDRERTSAAARREDLGSRLRREERKARREARRARRRAEATATEAGDEPRPSSASEDADVNEVRQDVQDAFE